MNPTPGKGLAAIGQAWLELSLIVLLCFVQAGSPPPAVNESHYLGKAKHYWEPTWCQGDFFLESADAHLVFYWTFGWITQLVSLTAAAWIGRTLAWLLLALAWRSLIRKLTPLAWAPLAAMVLLLPLLQFGHLSGEWLVGGIEAKGFSYPLVLWAVGSIVDRQWWRVWPLLGLAASFHVLVGGWAVIACLLTWFWRREKDQLRFRELCCWLLVGGLCALPGLLPALQLTGQATPSEIQEASRIYTYKRLRHHLVFQAFPWHHMLRFGAMVWVWWRVAKLDPTTDRLARLRAVVSASLLICAAGITVDFLTGPFPGLRAGLLRYYWFRLSDVLVPMGLAINIVYLLALPRRKQLDRWLVCCFLLATIGIGCAMVQTGCAARATAMQQQNWPTLTGRGFDIEQIDADWQQACRWVREHTPPNSLFLTPVRQQTFKWLAHRGEVVTWKDVPQDAKALLAWWTRRQEVYLLKPWPWNEPEKLANLADEYGVSHVIWPRSQSSLPPEAEILFANDAFVVCSLTR